MTFVIDPAIYHVKSSILPYKWFEGKEDPSRLTDSILPVYYFGLAP